MRQKVICADCREIAEQAGKGLCYRCYRRHQRERERIEEDQEFAEAVE